MDIENFSSLIKLEDLRTYQLLIDYTKSLAWMISQGRYEWVNSGITQENFPCVGQGKQAVEAVTFPFRKGMGSVAVVQEFARMNLNPPTLEALLTLRMTTIALPGKPLSIVALNPVWPLDPNGAYSAIIDVDMGGTHHLGLYSFPFDWPEDGLSFLALRHSS